MIISIYAQKATVKIRYLFTLKPLKIVKHRRNLTQYNMSYKYRPTTKATLNGEKLKSLPLRSRENRSTLSLLLFSIVTRKIKDIQFERERVKLILFPGGIYIYIYIH